MAVRTRVVLPRAMTRSIAAHETLNHPLLRHLGFSNHVVGFAHIRALLGIGLWWGLYYLALLPVLDEAGNMEVSPGHLEESVSYFLEAEARRGIGALLIAIRAIRGCGAV